MLTTCHVTRWPPYMAWKRSTMTKYGVQSIRRSSRDITWRPGLRCSQAWRQCLFSTCSTLPRMDHLWPISVTVTMALSCISSEIKPDIGQKSWFFHTPLHSTPPLGRGGSPSEYCHPVWYGKTKMVGLSDGKKNFEDIYNRLDWIPACDKWTDRQTDNLPRHSQRYAYASRGKNEFI